MRRVRVLGDLYHGRIPEGAIYVGRAAPGLPASPYANPFKVSTFGADALPMFAAYLERNPRLVDGSCRDSTLPAGASSAIRATGTIWCG